MVRPDGERHKAEKNDRVNQGFVTPQWLTGVVCDDLSDDSHCRQNQNVDFRVCEEPKEVLPQQRATTPSDLKNLVANYQARREEETSAKDAVHELKNARRLEWRKSQQQQERRY